ncbi:MULTISPECIES: DMT family transporter [Halorussus]|uniref:DMT family transporter n=1 Tax=Halorussus TaxID=1070314 RepID=UPI00209E0C37|nr:DMT family transporter [Halorussus vallis]USZ76203.1 DMT family transporter [Halorussus vallis]
MTRARDVSSFLLMTLLFGGAFPAIEVGLRILPPLLLATIRYGTSALLLLGYAAARTDRWLPRSRGDWSAVVAGGVLFIGGTAFTFVGQQFTTAGVAAVIFSAIPVLTVVVGWALLPDQHLSRRGLLGLLVGFLGVAVVVDPTTVDLRAGLVGGLLVFLAALSVTVGTVLVRRSHPEMSVVGLTGWAMLVGAAIQYGASVAAGESTAGVRVTLLGALAVAYLAVLASGVGFVIYFGLLERFGPLEVNLVSYVVPVVSVALGWAFLDEPVTATTLVGFGVIVAGFLLLKEKDLAAELAKYRGAGR